MSDAVVDAARALADANVAMDARFSALFRLRSLGTEDAVRALVERLDREREASALMRHEVAFALGQMGATGAIEALCETLADSSENGMVRHECAEALGALGSEHARCVEALRTACVDEKREVAETAALALRKLERHGREMSGSARGSAKERASASVERARTRGRRRISASTPCRRCRRKLISRNCDESCATRRRRCGIGAGRCSR